MSAKPTLSIRNISKYFGGFTALEDVSIDIMPGEFFALLGPSGCGKSTLLRIIAGFETLSRGELLLDNEDMTATPPNKRPVNMVFQSYAVFPHMSVARNIAYGLQLQGLSKPDIKQRVDEALEQVHLSEFRHRMPDQLSGGQRQRVALARALVKKPRVLLLDEPLSALDAKLRDAMRLELVKLQQSVGVTFIMVTHDQSEALAMADRIAVLESGRLRQLDTPESLYRNPCDVFVADFIGNINLFKVEHAQPHDGNVLLKTEELGDIILPPEKLPNNWQTLTRLHIAIRPERINIRASNQSTEQPGIKGKLGDVAFQGESSIVEIILDSGRSISAFAQESNAVYLEQADMGAEVWCGWNIGDMLVISD